MHTTENSATVKNDPTRRSRVRSIPRSPLFVSVVAFGLRLVTMGMVQNWPLNARSPLWKSGLEIVNIASSIASGKGFSSPFGIDSGATAWIPPVYPALVGGLFRLTGQRSNLSAIIILVLQGLFSAIACIPLYAITEEVFDEQCAIFTTWGWAVLPYVLLIPELFIWETSLSALLMMVACYFSLRLLRGAWNPIWAGVVWGIAALTNTALISVLPVLLCVPYLKKAAPFPYKAVSAAILISIVVVCPWMIRNWCVLHVNVPVRSNFGEELWVGNHEGGTGRIQAGYGPAESEVERERYRRMGEILYLRQRQAEAVRFISQNPIQFGRWVFYRLRYWWFAEGESAPIFTFYRFLTLVSLAGIALSLPRMKDGATLAILLSTLVFPLVYYLTNVYVRYRYPIEPFLMMFGGFAVSRLFMLRNNENRRRLRV